MSLEAAVVPEFVVAVTEKGGQEKRTVFRSGQVSLGRVQGNDVVLPKGNVSKKHARILFREGRFVVTDLNSTNGTYVNGQRVTQATLLREEDKIIIGDFIIRIEVTGEAPGGGDEPLTPRREGEAPIPSIVPDSETSTINRSSSAPPWEKSAFDDVSATRASVLPAAPRVTEPPPAGEPHPSQRFADQWNSLRRAVGLVWEKVEKAKGRPTIEPEAKTAKEVREFVSQVVDQFLVDGLIPVGTSADAVADHAVAELLDVGPLRELLRDPAVSAIAAARFDDVQDIRDGRAQPAGPSFSSAVAAELCLMRLAARGRTEVSENISTTVLPDGARLTFSTRQFSPDGPVFSIEKPRRVQSSLDDLVRRGAISRAMATFLSSAIQARMNILVVGPRDDGANTVLGALAASATATPNRERILCSSDFDEFVIEGEQLVRLGAGSPRALKDALEIASLVPASRLIATLSDSKRVLTVLDGLSLGASGVLVSYRGGYLARVLERLPVELVAAREGLDHRSAVHWLAGSFDLVLEVARLRDGRVRVLAVAELNVDEHGKLEASDIFRFSASRVAAGGAVEGSFTPSGVIPKALAQLQLHGLRVETSLFSRPPSKQT